MVYLFVFAIFIVRIFGFRRSMQWLSDAFDSLMNGDTSSRLDRKLREVLAQKKNERVARYTSETDRVVDNKIAIPAWTGTKPKRKKPPRRPKPLKNADLLQASGRSSEDILSGKPDFGWRRVY